MPRLLLFRHAKSLRDDPALADFDRPLAPRGEREAEQMGRLLATRGLVPDRILCSTAARARGTLAQALLHLSGHPQTDYRDDLYHASGTGYAGLIAAHGGTANTLMVVGHNPTIQKTALWLIDGSEPELAAQLGANYPTGAIAVIDFDLAGWSEIRPGAGRLAAFLQPRDD